MTAPARTCPGGCGATIRRLCTCTCSTCAQPIVAGLPCGRCDPQNGRLRCGRCGCAMTLRGPETNRFGKPWWCCTRWPACDGSHGAHPDGTPLGVPADARTKAARQRAHAAFDPIWQGATSRKKAARVQAYGWLRRQLGWTRSRTAAGVITWTRGIPRESCHVGMFTVAQCQAVERAVACRAFRRAARAQFGGRA